MPRPIAWSGVAAGVLILLADIIEPQMNITIPAIFSFLIGAILMGLGIYLSLPVKSDSSENPVAAGSSTPMNRTEGINGNRGIITQGQSGGEISVSK